MADLLQGKDADSPTQIDLRAETVGRRFSLPGLDRSFGTIVLRNFHQKGSMTMAEDQDKRRQIAEADQDKRRLELVAEAVTFTIEAYSRMRGRSQPDTTLAELKTLLGEMSDVPVIVALQKYAEVRVDSLEGQSAETIEQMKARILERSKLAKAATQTRRTDAGADDKEV